MWRLRNEEMGDGETWGRGERETWGRGDLGKGEL